jgi:hypothetical protein
MYLAIPVALITPRTSTLASPLRPIEAAYASHAPNAILSMNGSTWDPRPSAAYAVHRLAPVMLGSCTTGSALLTYLVYCVASPPTLTSYRCDMSLLAAAGTVNVSSFGSDTGESSLLPSVLEKLRSQPVLPCFSLASFTDQFRL